MTLNYKYGLGDKVKLIKMPSYDNWQYGVFSCDNREEKLPKEYVINGYGFDETEDGIEQYYRLYAYCDDLIQYHNHIPDECLEPAGECHPIEVESDIMSADGHVIKIDDSIFQGLYRRLYGNNGPTPNTSFSFTSHGTVVGLHYFMEVNGNPRIQVTYVRDFLCSYCVDGEVREAMDARKHGYKCTDYAYQIDYGVHPGYIEEYAKEISKKSNRWYLEHDKYDIEQWLKFLGIYNETMEAVDRWIKIRDGKAPKKKGSTKKKKVKKDEDKLQDFLSTLTEEQKKKLKEML